MGALRKLHFQGTYMYVKPGTHTCIIKESITCKAQGVIHFDGVLRGVGSYIFPVHYNTEFRIKKQNNMTSLKCANHGVC